jgi:DNA polymerase
MKIDINKVVTVDAETFYSTEFSLTKKELNTSSYIRDEQFKEHCWGIKIGKKPAKCYTAAEGIKILKGIDWKTHYLLAHNTAFDGFILAHHHGIVPHFYLDTLSMTRGLHADLSRAKLDTIAKLYGIGAKSETYLTPTKGLRDLPKDVLKGLMDGCKIDVGLCFNVFLKQLAVYPMDELRLIDITIRMFCDSKLEVDIPRAQQALQEEMLARRASIMKSKCSEEDLMSNPKFAAQLRKLGVEPPTKISLKTGHENFAFAQTDPEFLELLDHEDKRVVLLAQGRLAAKSTQVETRANRLIQAGENGMKLPAGYNYYAAKTGRWGGTNKLNLQNLPRGSELRRSIAAPKGHVLIVSDSAQIEARMLAWLAGQQDVLDAFAAGEDVYKIMASAIYGKPLDSVTKDERFVGKVAVLGLGYGMGAKKFQTTLELGAMGPPMMITATEAKRVVNLYRKRNHKIPVAWKEAEQMLHRMARGESGAAFGGVIEFDGDTIWLPNGMPINYPGLHISESGAFKYKSFDVYKYVYGGLVVENIVQAIARIAVGEQALLISDELEKIKLKKNEVTAISMLTHDEVVTTAPERLAEKFMGTQLKCMRTPRPWCPTMPFNADGGYDTCYSK